jgi:cupin fold WbuC family metalloprotein
MNIEIFSLDFLDRLTQLAEQSNRQRQHENVHKNYDEPCQILFNAIGMNSYIRPHRHSIDSKHETLVAVRGRMAFLVFDNYGNLEKIVRFGAQSIEGQSFLSAGVNLQADVWHTVIAEVPGSILLEVKAGPFKPRKAKEFAIWAPEEDSPQAAEYLIQLKKSVFAM